MKINAIIVSITLMTLVLFVGVGEHVEAAIYKCISAEGETYYNDKACPKNAKQTELNNVKDPVGGYIAPGLLENAKENGSKAAINGEQASAKNTANIDKDQNSSNGNDVRDSSDGSDSITDNSNDESEALEETTDIGELNRAIRKPPLPTIPLKVDPKARETRAKVE